MKERIKQIRKSLGMTQTEFGNTIGMTRDGIAAYERGVAKPPLANVKLICSTHGISEQWLLTGEGEMKASSEEEIFAQKLADELANGSEAFRSLIRAYMDLSDENKDVIDLFIKRLAAEMSGQPTVPDYTSLPVVPAPDEAAAQ